jgi:hypothetical protein
MQDNIVLLIILVIIGCSNLIMTFILNAKKCQDELRHWESIHRLNEKFHRK